MFVSPVLRSASQGRDKQSFNVINPKTGEMTPGKSMNKTREVGTSVTLKFPLDTYQNKYVTGLDELIPNPVYGMTEADVLSTYSLSPQWQEFLSKIVSQKQISRQIWFEIQDNVEPDYYTSAVKNGTMLSFQPSQLINRVATSTFIEKFAVELFDRPNRFVDDTPRQRMAMQLIKNHNRIAANKLEANPVEHLFYISEENEAEMEKMRKQDLIDDAVASKRDLQKKSSEFVNYKVASLLTTKQGKPIVKGVTPRDSVNQAMNNFIHDKTFQMDNIKKFMDIVELLNTSEGKQRFEVKYLVQQGLNTHVLDNSDGYIVWNSRSSEKNIYKWTDYEKLISFLVSEMIVFDPLLEDAPTNWYNELFKEVKSKNVWVE